jgi:hypothetical protein
MSNYFEFASQELLIKLAQIKEYIKKHNPTIGVLTEEILRSFLRNHLPKAVSVEQGFILTEDGELSKQCDIIIYDSQSYSPFYRINDIVVVPAESVICIIEVKTTINRQIFHDIINYFKNMPYIENARTYLFIFNSKDISNIKRYFDTYKHEGNYQMFDHDTFQLLPDEITGINESYHLTKDYVIIDRDAIGYSSRYYEDLKGTDINALQIFFTSVYQAVESHIELNYINTKSLPKRAAYHKNNLVSIRAFELFEM